MMKELDISVYSSSTCSNLSNQDLENELVSKALDEELTNNHTQTATNLPENETYCNSIFKELCLNFWNNSKTNNKLETIQHEAANKQSSSETLKQTEHQTNNLKRIVRVDEHVRQSILDFNSWSLDSNTTNSNCSTATKNSNLKSSNFNFYDSTSSNETLSRSLDLITKKTQSLATISTINSRDELSLKRALSDICKTQRLSTVSTVSGSFSLRLNEDKELVPVYLSKN